MQSKRRVEQDKVVTLLGSNLSGPTIAVADICAKNKVPQIASFATNTMVTQTEDGKVRPWSFRLCFTDPYQGRIIANYAVNTLNLKKCCHSLRCDQRLFNRYHSGNRKELC